MYFRKKTSGGRAYLQIVESRREGAAVRQQVIATLGRVEDLRESGQLERLLRSGARFAASRRFAAQICHPRFRRRAIWFATRGHRRRRKFGAWSLSHRYSRKAFMIPARCRSSFEPKQQVFHRFDSLRLPRPIENASIGRARSAVDRCSQRPTTRPRRRIDAIRGDEGGKPAPCTHRSLCGPERAAGQSGCDAPRSESGHRQGRVVQCSLSRKRMVFAFRCR